MMLKTCKYTLYLVTIWKVYFTLIFLVAELHMQSRTLESMRSYKCHTWFLWILEIMKYVLIGAWHRFGVCIPGSGDSVPRFLSHCSNSLVWEAGKKAGESSGHCRMMIMCLFPPLHFILQRLKCKTLFKLHLWLLPKHCPLPFTPPPTPAHPRNFCEIWFCKERAVLGVKGQFKEGRWLLRSTCLTKAF